MSKQKEEHDIKVREMVLRVAKKHIKSDLKNIPEKISAKDNQEILMSVLKQIIDENPLMIESLDEIVNDFHVGMEEVVGYKFEVVMPEECSVKN